MLEKAGVSVAISTLDQLSVRIRVIVCSSALFAGELRLDLHRRVPPLRDPHAEIPHRNSRVRSRHAGRPVPPRSGRDRATSRGGGREDLRKERRGGAGDREEDGDREGSGRGDQETARTADCRGEGEEDQEDAEMICIKVE